MAQFLHKKKDSNFWYFRRRFPQDLVETIGKQMYMQSLQTPNKREAEQRARVVSVEFDTLCENLRAQIRVSSAVVETRFSEQSKQPSIKAAEQVFHQIPGLVRQAASRVVEEQQKNPKEWLGTVGKWQSFYQAMLSGAVPQEAQIPAVEAQAILNGFEMAIQGNPPPASPIHPQGNGIMQHSTLCTTADWNSLCDKAIDQYKHQVTRQRCRTAQLKLKEITPKTLSIACIQEALKTWSIRKLEEVQASTVKIQLDAMVSALKQVLPEITSPRIPQLKGALQPKNSDRESIPLDALTSTIRSLRAITKGGRKETAASFDDVAVETLAVLGLRPSELLGASTSALVPKTDIYNKTGMYFRVASGKNNSSKRDIPLSDGTREVINLARLKQMLTWQEQRKSTRDSAVSSLNKRFNKATSGYTLYQMRHTWKDICEKCNVDHELSEKMMGHRTAGIAHVYGSGIPLEKGLDALSAIRRVIEEFGQGKDAEHVTGEAVT